MNIGHRYRVYTAILLSGYSILMHASRTGMQAVVSGHHLVTWLVVVLLLAVLLMIFTNRFYYRRERKINAEAKQLNAQLALVLNANKTQVWTFDIQRRIYSVLSDDGQVNAEYTPIDFGQTFYDIVDFTKFREQLLFDVRDGRKQSGSMVIRERKKEGVSLVHTYEINLSVLHRDHDNKPRVLLGVQRDITDDELFHEGADMLALRYHTVFNNSQVDMVCYDANGTMTDINDKACSTFEVRDREQLLASKPNIQEVPSMEGIDIQSMCQMHSCAITDVNSIEKPIGDLDEKTWGTTKTYYEMIISPIRDDGGQLKSIVMAGRNISEMVNTQHYQRRIAQQLAKTTSDIQEYIGTINYTLRISGMRIVSYMIDTHELEIYSDLTKAQLRMSQVRCISLIAERHRRRARGIFLRMDSRRQAAFTETVQMRLHDSQRRDISLTFSMVPFSDKKGNVTHYFGICRDDTETVYTDRQLEQETQKAHETEELKNTFLTNMSYEIRTPLNAIIGFAELFDTPHEEADEQVFAAEIKRNTTELLKLVNDILYISKLDARMVEFNYAECDFATLFEGLCYMGWGNVHDGVQLSVDNPYNHLVVNIDEQNLSMVITKLCVNAARHTAKGFIHAKCEYRHGELTITIDDSGEGVSQELLTHVYDRFPTRELRDRYTTLLDMPIIKETVEQMGGTIEIQSEQGKGSTAYVIIPCEMISLEKKTENI